MDFKLEVVVLPVSNVDRSKHFYGLLGWRLDADFAISEELHIVQMTPPGSQASIHFGTGVTSAEPGSVKNTYLVVSDLEAARAELANRGVEVGEIFHRSSTFESHPGPDPEHKSYASFATFRDPDGNSWLLQEIRKRLPGRE